MLLREFEAAAGRALGVAVADVADPDATRFAVLATMGDVAAAAATRCATEAAALELDDLERQWDAIARAIENATGEEDHG